MPESNPILSVVTINKNNSYGLNFTLRSLEKIGYGNWEHIIVDGSSSDASPRIISEYILKNQNYRIKYICEKDEGIWDAMNKGAKVSNGLYLLFLNSGDEIRLNVNLIRFLDELKSSRKIWIHGSAIRIDAKTRQEEVFFDKEKIAFEEFIYGAQWIPHGATAISAKVFRTLGGYKAWSLISDQALFMKLWQFEAPSFSKNLILRFENGGVHESLTLLKRFKLWQHARRESYKFGGKRPDFLVGRYSYFLELIRALRNVFSKFVKGKL